jgi:hypothetical protein
LEIQDDKVYEQEAQGEEEKKPVEKKTLEELVEEEYESKCLQIVLNQIIEKRIEEHVVPIVAWLRAQAKKNSEQQPPKEVKYLV